MKKIMIAIDGGPLSEKAAQKGYALSKAMQAEVGLVYVVDPAGAVAETGYPANEWIERCKQEGEAILQRIKNELNDKGIWTFVDVGPPASTIVRIAAEWSADIIVVCTHGRKGISHLLTGSVAEHIIRHSKIPVLVVPANDN